MRLVVTTGPLVRHNDERIYRSGSLESPTFRKMWVAMAMAPKEKADYNLQTASEEFIHKWSAGASYVGQTNCSKTGCTSYVSPEGLGPDRIADEWSHAAGALSGAVKDSGFPGACYGNAHSSTAYQTQCQPVRDRIDNETDAANQKAASKQKKP